MLYSFPCFKHISFFKKSLDLKNTVCNQKYKRKQEISARIKFIFFSNALSNHGLLLSSIQLLFILENCQYSFCLCCVLWKALGFLFSLKMVSRIRREGIAFLWHCIPKVYAQGVERCVWAPPPCQVSKYNFVRRKQSFY